MADAQSSQERTESPTPKRREQARSEGRVARSQDLSAATVVTAGSVLLATLGGATLVAFATSFLRMSTGLMSSDALSANGGVALLRSVVGRLVIALMPFLLGLGAIVLFVNLAQTRATFSLKPLEPKWSHLNPISGFKKFFSPEAVVQLLKSIAKVVALGVVATMTLSDAWPQLTSLSENGPTQIATVIPALLLRLALTTGVAFLVIAVADYGFQWARTERGMRMTRQEVLQEHRESEGDPLIKGRILAIGRARARKRMLQAVPMADVVITNPTHVAVALKYDTSVALAPIVIAMGERKLAERIKAIARKAGVPLVENPPVARALLATAEPGRPIPPALYAAIAEILAFVYRQRGGLPGLRHAHHDGGRA